MKKTVPNYTYSNNSKEKDVPQLREQSVRWSQPVNWDYVDSGKNNSTLVFHQAEDGLDDQFQDLSPESVGKRLDMDADPLIEGLGKNFTFSSNPNRHNITEFTMMATNADETMGAYFHARSQFPPGEVRESLLQLRDCLPKSRESTSREPRESLSTFFIGEGSDGIGPQGIINSVMKYCLEKQASEKTVLLQKREPETSPPYLRREDRYSEGVGIMDITAISQAPSSPPYSPPHSTPKRRSDRSEFYCASTSRCSSKDGRNKSVREILQDAERPRSSKSYRATEVQSKPNLPEKLEQTISPNSSISSSATSVASNSGAQRQLQIYKSRSTTSINLPVPPNNAQNIPIFIQVQCPCSNAGKNARSAHDRRSQITAQVQPIPVAVPGPAPPQNVNSAPHGHGHSMVQQPFMMMPVAMMPMYMPMSVPLNQPNQAPRNPQCQCSCNSCHK